VKSEKGGSVGARSAFLLFTFHFSLFTFHAVTYFWLIAAPCGVTVSGRVERASARISDTEGLLFTKQV